jgi:2-keto-4-pentenoate hydratase/2-oxohepta-3-ene-1,7-dioic acid hydratase in catechol pathway
LRHNIAMRYVTFSLQRDDTTRLGVLDGDEVVHLQSLSPIDSNPLPGSLAALIEAGPVHWAHIAQMLQDVLPRRSGIRHPIDKIRWHAPLPRPAKNIICLGLNYANHAIESAAARGRDPKIPKDPVFFTKAPTAVNGPFDEIRVDRRATEQVDWEAELGVVIGVRGKNIERADALRHVFGYTIINDVTARDLQARHIQWFKGKSLDGFAPMGPCIVTADEFGDPQRKRIACRVNGVTKQDANTAQMIFGVDAIIEALSRGFTLEPGDIISTGTPEGVGMGRTPQEFLRDGDIVETDVEGIGVIRNRISG